jgi:predicted metalloprotease with PDZ domain
MGVLGEEVLSPELELKFPMLWSKVSTGLKDISLNRSTFLYESKNYDELIDSPIEIGCHETDGFSLFGVDHELAFYGNQLNHSRNLKEDIKTIVNTIGSFFGGVPYERYSFITHFVPGIYGGLEHLNSTALHFCPTGLNQRKNYINFLCLVSHEYFHLWNVKRIRPTELGPFNYLKEATTKMLWLAEGLTSLMDELFVLRSGLINLEEYLELQKDNLNRYLSIPGKKFHSLDDSSFNAWIKLYRPDENSNNSSISYYLKGGIVFWVFHLMAFQKSLSIDHLVKKLWDEYLSNPKVGLTEDRFYELVLEVFGLDLKEKLELMIKTTNDIDFETLLSSVGISVVWEKTESTYFGAEVEYLGDRVIFKSITLDGPLYKYGVNAGDEFIAIDNMRILKDRYTDASKFLRPNTEYQFTLSRLGQIIQIPVVLELAPKKIATLVVKDSQLASKIF